MLRRVNFLALLFIASVVLTQGCTGDTPDVTTMAVQHVGLSLDAAIPPLGVGVPPRAGDGGDGAPVVTQVGASSSRPGSIRWHGGQWVVPLSVAPGSVLANAMCSVLTNPTATDLVELVSSNGGVIASNTVPAASGLNIWTWLIPTASHVVVDGEQLIIRHSPRDSMSGAWTSASQDLTLVSCAVNARRARTYKLNPLSGVNVGAGAFQVQSGNLTGGWSPLNDGDLLGLELRAEVGERFEQVTASVYGNTGYTVTMTMLGEDDAFHVATDLGHTASSAANSLQTLTIPSTEVVTTSTRNYALQFRASKLGATEGQPIVGPIMLTTSTL